eukprot:gene470-879_t
MMADGELQLSGRVKSVGLSYYEEAIDGGINNGDFPQDTGRLQMKTMNWQKISKFLLGVSIILAVLITLVFVKLRLDKIGIPNHIRVQYLPEQITYVPHTWNESEWIPLDFPPNTSSVNSSSSDSTNTNETIQLLYSPTSGNIYGIIPISWTDPSRMFLYVEQIVEGLGIRDLLYDTGNILTSNAITFKIMDNNKLVIVSPQLRYRGVRPSSNSYYNAHKMPLRSSRDFSDGILYSTPIMRRNEQGFLINLTDLCLSYTAKGWNEFGMFDLSDTIARVYGSEYKYSIDINKSFIVKSGCVTNTRGMLLHTMLTYSISDHTPPPSALKTALPLGSSITVGIGRSILPLPVMNSSHFNRRRFHPKSGFNAITYFNESAGLLDRRDTHNIVRFDLHQEQEQQPSESERRRKKLLYYVDRSAPEYIQRALVEGASWWDEAFQYAGFLPDTFHVEVAPEDFNPFDLTQCHLVSGFIQWSHRDVRSFSFGLRIEDPRDGRILRGHVVIGSLRVRQITLIAQLVFSPFNFSQSTTYSAMIANNISDLVVRRCRDLAAHEVGHSLGLTHNFAASSSSSSPSGGFSSVMDYPPPLLTLDSQGNIVLNTHSYGDGIGTFDKISINYGYRELNCSSASPSLPVIPHPGHEEGESVTECEWRQLRQIISEAEVVDGYVFLTDQDANGGDSDWRDTMWDSGSDPILALDQALAVRTAALSTLREAAVGIDSPVSSLADGLPVLFLWHRYEIEAVSKLLGGMSFQYAVRGDVKTQSAATVLVPGDMQRRALRKLVEAMSPDVIAVPRRLRSLLLPSAFGYRGVDAIGGEDDLFQSRTGHSFDVLATAETAAGLVVDAVFASDRVERIVVQRSASVTSSNNSDSSSASLPGLLEVLSAFTDGVILFRDLRRDSSRGLALESMVSQAVLVDGLIRLSKSSSSLSSAAQGLLAFHMRTLSSAIAVKVAGLNSSSVCFPEPTSTSLECVILLAEWQAHFEFLHQSIVNNQPFLTRLAVPTGPPL